MRSFQIDLANGIRLEIQQWVGEADGANFSQPGIPVDFVVFSLLHALRLTLAVALVLEACPAQAVYLGSSAP